VLKPAPVLREGDIKSTDYHKNNVTSKAGFLKKIFWYSQSDNHPENNLAKFGYNNTYEGFEKKKKQNSSIFLATFWKLS